MCVCEGGVCVCERVKHDGKMGVRGWGVCVCEGGVCVCERVKHDGKMGVHVARVKINV